MNIAKVTKILKNYEIQDAINAFVEEIIFKYKNDKELLKSNGTTFQEIYEKIILNRAHNTISRSPIKYTKSVTYSKPAFIGIYKSNVYPSFKNNTIDNITSKIIDPGFKVFDNMYNGTILQNGQRVGTLQKYNNIIQKYLFCIGHYTGTKVSINEEIKKEALTLIKDKYLDCPIDNYIFDNIVEYEFLTHFVNANTHKPRKIKEYTPWSRLDKGLYDELVLGISKSCDEILYLNSIGAILTKNHNAKYLSDKFINHGLLFDLLFWERKPKPNTKAKKNLDK